MISLHDIRHLRLGSANLAAATRIAGPRQLPFAPDSFRKWVARPDIPEFKDRAALHAVARWC